MIESMGSTHQSASIRHASATDASELSDLGARTFRAAYAEANGAHLVDAYIADHYSTAIQLAELQDERLLYLVAEIDARLVGFALLRTDQSHPDVVGTNPIRLARIYMDMPYLGSGLGSVLMEHCITDCRRRGHDVLWVGVWEENRRAISFYERWGFNRIGTEIFDVGGDVQRDAILVLSVPGTEPDDAPAQGVDAGTD
jgi:diamine N-acetyltransferase